MAKALDGDIFGEALPPPTDIVYTPGEKAILKEIAERQLKKKKKGKVAKKTTCSLWNGKCSGKKQLVDEDSTAASSTSDSKKMLSADLAAGTKATKEEEIEVSLHDAEKIGTLDSNDDDEVNSPFGDEHIHADPLPSPKVVKTELVAEPMAIDQDLSFA